VKTEKLSKKLQKKSDKMSIRNEFFGLYYVERLKLKHKDRFL